MQYFLKVLNGLQYFLKVLNGLQYLDFEEILSKYYEAIKNGTFLGFRSLLNIKIESSCFSDMVKHEQEVSASPYDIKYISGSFILQNPEGKHNTVLELGKNIGETPNTVASLLLKA